MSSLLLMIAQAWWRLSHEDREKIRNIARSLAVSLDVADERTRGEPSRCVCTAAPYHDMRCPARRT